MSDGHSKGEMKESILKVAKGEEAEFGFIGESIGLSRYSAEHAETIAEILEILHEKGVTVFEAERLLRDTYKMMCLGATI